MNPGGNDRLELDDTVGEATEATPEWAVPEQYLVEDGRDPSEATVVATNAPRARRIPLGRASLPLAVAILLLGSLALIPLLTSPGESASGSSLDHPAPADLGGIVTTAPRQTKADAGLEAARVEVPDVKGASVSEATHALAKRHLRVKTRAVKSDREPGAVLEQEPGAGDRVARGSLVVLLVSHRAPTRQVAGIDVPDLVGLRADRAAELARAKGLRVEVRSVLSSARPGTVVRQLPAGGESAVRGSLVELSVAKSARRVVTVRVPRLTGLTLAEAKARLSDRGLRWSVERVPSSRPVGIVLDQVDPAGAIVEKGTRVTLEVSSGPQLIAVPDVVGLDVVDARQQLEAEGFIVTVTESPTTDPADDGVVLDQSPGGGAKLREGAEVTIYVGMAG